MNRSNLPSPDSIRRFATFAPPPPPPERQSAPRNPRLRNSQRTVVVMPTDMLEQIKEYQSEHGLASGQAAIRKLLANALGMEWEAEMPGDERVSSTKWTAEIRPEIERMYQAGVSMATIAEHFGISQSYASMIRSGKR